ncbi:Z1 domain-containing protein [Aerococcaceae bacterium DSM 111020]|nr:Z1 domain-containing protein [Aerococcaceae bacterium DSM 111020]
MTKFRDIKYSKLIRHAEELYEQSSNWDEVRNLTLHKENMGSELSEDTILERILGWSVDSELLTGEIWHELIDYLEDLTAEKKVSKIDDGALNDAKIPQDSSSSWMTYKRKLENDGWTDSSINAIQTSAFEILKHFAMDHDNSPEKGLAIGNVQSGKTANMIGLMTLAADNGFNFFIVLSGMIDSLRIQTANRMASDLNSKSHKNSWYSIENPSLGSNLPEHNMSRFDLSENSRHKYYSVLLKNKSRLQNFLDWIKKSDQAKARQLKIVIIDDEADQASINTKEIEKEMSAINHLITELVYLDHVKAVNYVAYTATPYANILNDSGERSLYPKNFIFMLPENSDYIGPEQIFQLQEPEAQPNIDIVMPIRESDRERILEIQEGETHLSIPRSLKDSINWFLICVAAMRSQNFRKPISMLVHTSFKKDEHEYIAQVIKNYLLELNALFEDYIERFEHQYNDFKNFFSRNHFVEGMPNYSATENVPNYPSWGQVRSHLSTIMRLEDEEYLSHIQIADTGELKYHSGIHLSIDNSTKRTGDEQVRLVYPDKNKMPKLAPAFIVVGGNTLSRGLTIEGLVSTYFLRTTKQADTLMQMGRWFGYRKRYEIYPRIWLDQLAYERFEFITQLNYELRQEVEDHAAKGFSPNEYAIAVKNSPNRSFLAITSQNKMQSAIPASYDFSGYVAQTIYFERDVKKLQHNYDLTKNFLNALPNLDQDSLNSHMIWRDIDHVAVREYLENYIVYEKDIKMSNLSSVLDWIEDNYKNSDQPFTNWNVVLSSLSGVESTKDNDSDWNIQGYHPQAIVRSLKPERSTDNVANIGVLRSVADQVIDTGLKLESNDLSSVYATRKEANLDRTPLLVIYRIDKVSQPKQGTKRKPLGFPVDPIGIYIQMPGFSRANTAVDRVQLVPPKVGINEDDYDELLAKEENNNAED